MDDIDRRAKPLRQNTPGRMRVAPFRGAFLAVAVRVGVAKGHFRPRLRRPSSFQAQFSAIQRQRVVRSAVVLTRTGKVAAAAIEPRPRLIIGQAQEADLLLPQVQANLVVVAVNNPAPIQR